MQDVKKDEWTMDHAGVLHQILNELKDKAKLSDIEKLDDSNPRKFVLQNLRYIGLKLNAALDTEIQAQGGTNGLRMDLWTMVGKTATSIDSETINALVEVFADKSSEPQNGLSETNNELSVGFQQTRIPGIFLRIAQCIDASGNFPDLNYRTYQLVGKNHFRPHPQPQSAPPTPIS
ncbi:hypothetical protein HY612_00430 [Candidatus Roizmanbacteria bacterium]|nr:hypothetical protein [Candidatus Roizmanbacteria bacterium]